MPYLDNPTIFIIWTYCYEKCWDAKMMLQTLCNMLQFFLAAALVCGKYTVMASIALMNCVAGLYGKLPVKLD